MLSPVVVRVCLSVLVPALVPVVAWGAPPVPPAAELPSVDAVLARLVDAGDGRVAVERIEVRHYRGTIVLVPGTLPAEHCALYFDEETGLLGHVGYHNDLHGWHDVDGVLFPEKWVFGRKGGNTTYVFEEASSGPAPPGK